MPCCNASTDTVHDYRVQIIKDIFTVKKKCFLCLYFVDVQRPPYGCFFISTIVFFIVRFYWTCSRGIFFMNTNYTSKVCKIKKCNIFINNIANLNKLW